MVNELILCVGLPSIDHKDDNGPECCQTWSSNIASIMRVICDEAPKKFASREARDDCDDPKAEAGDRMCAQEPTLEGEADGGADSE